MERCIKSIKGELGSLASYQDIDELYYGAANAIAYYNNDRIHTVLKTSLRDYARSLQKSKSRMDKLFDKKVA